MERVLILIFYQSLLMSLPLNFQELLAGAFLIVCVWGGGAPLEKASVGTHRSPSLHLPGCRAAGRWVGMRAGWVASSTGVLVLPQPAAPSPAQAAAWSFRLSC